MGVALVKDADKKIAKLVAKKEVQSILKNVNDDVANFIPVKFVEDMRKLIVKVAQIMAEVSNAGKLADETYPTAIKFLCKDVLKNKNLAKEFEALELHEIASKSKSALEKVDEGPVAESIYKYHRLIGELVATFNIHALEGIIITSVIGSAVKEKKAKKPEKKVEPTPVKKQEVKSKVEPTPVKKQEVKSKVEPAKKPEKTAAVEQPKKLQPEKKNEPIKAKEPAVTPTASALQPKKTVTTHDKAKAVYVDEAVGTLTVELSRGDGWYERGMARKDFFQCMININFEGNGKYDLKSAQVEVNSFKVNNTEIQKLVKTPVIVVKSGESDLDIEMDISRMRKFLNEVGGDNVNRLPTQVSLSVTAMVKSGVKTKKLPCDVSCVF